MQRNTLVGAASAAAFAVLCVAMSSWFAGAAAFSQASASDWAIAQITNAAKQ